MGMIFREEEKNILANLLNSDQAEFLAIYGRRRIGKTYLIRDFFKKQTYAAVFFNTTGSKNAPFIEQIKHFTKTIGDVFYHGATLKVEDNWDATFALLTKSINTLPKNKKIVLFLDEFPWMNTRKSRLLQNLDYHWNQYWSEDKRIKLIICGSSASWIINNIINNKGGLHNRITKQILLEPLDLHDVRYFLHRHKVRLNNTQILQIYMVTGGVPYYLTHIKKGYSATQIIEQIAFSKKGMLVNEFNNLFSSLFNHHEIAIEMIRLIAAHRYGIGQEELFKKLGKNYKGKMGLAKLDELEKAGFIVSFKPYRHKQKGIYYKVIDEYVLFYLKWIEPIKETLLKKSLAPGYWDKQQNSAAWHSWSGLAFEAICYEHIEQIRDALRLSPTAIPDSWRYVPHKKAKENGAQIDLLFDRDDGAITLCEIKFTSAPFVIDKEEAFKLQQKIAVFKAKTRTKKQIFLSFISANGLQPTMYMEALVDKVVTLNDLFQRNRSK